MGNNEYRSFAGKLRVLSKENEFLYRIEVALLNGEVNRNNWRYENLDEHRALFADTPILVAYLDDGRQIGDGHNFSMKRDKNGDEVASFTASDAERIVGWFPDAEQIRIEERDGIRWIIGVGYLWAWYSYELTEMLNSQGERGMEVSIETLIETMRMENSTEVFEKYKILGTTILGKGVTPAVAGARIRKLTDIGSQVEQLKLRVAAYKGETPKQSKEGVKMRMSKKVLAELQAKFDVVAASAYRVLAASDDGLRVCLMSADGIPCVYEFTSKEDTNAIVPERIARVSAATVFRFDGSELNIDVTEITDNLIAEIVAANAKADSTEKRALKAESEAQTLRDKESKRRVEAAKHAARSKLVEINSVRKSSERIDEAVCKDIIDGSEKYKDMEDENGDWCGDTRIAADVAARCMDEIVSIGKRNNDAKNTISVWDIANNAEKHDSGIESVLAHINQE